MAVMNLTKFRLMLPHLTLALCLGCLGSLTARAVPLTSTTPGRQLLSEPNRDDVRNPYGALLNDLKSKGASPVLSMESGLISAVSSSPVSAFGGGGGGSTSYSPGPFSAPVVFPSVYSPPKVFSNAPTYVPWTYILPPVAPPKLISSTVIVPDGGVTIILLGCGLLVLFVYGRRFAV